MELPTLECVNTPLPPDEWDKDVMDGPTEMIETHREMDHQETMQDIFQRWYETPKTSMENFMYTFSILKRVETNAICVRDVRNLQEILNVKMDIIGYVKHGDEVIFYNFIRANTIKDGVLQKGCGVIRQNILPEYPREIQEIYGRWYPETDPLKSENVHAFFESLAHIKYVHTEKISIPDIRLLEEFARVEILVLGNVRVDNYLDAMKRQVSRVDHFKYVPAKHIARHGTLQIGCGILLLQEKK